MGCGAIGTRARTRPLYSRYMTLFNGVVESTASRIAESTVSRIAKYSGLNKSHDRDESRAVLRSHRLCVDCVHQTVAMSKTDDWWKQEINQTKLMSDQPGVDQSFAEIVRLL